ncbi:unnamed protein product [Parnassius apollo]|uniref:(apollo) hypothetical protein n=1 Tax=Parnassius apollo TaxID=110799 RepID=A0A8S3XDJ5_PARAO|nr:unnamed protein product [Parnassius apollo]
MSSRGDQDGRRPALPAQPRPPSESQTETEKEQTTDQPKQICRNYVWGTCSKNAKCKLRHELDVEEMKKILIFCQDYQNRTGCTREDCKYLHTTKEEENLFLTTGQIPRVLAERHAAMSATANVENIPQIAFFIKDSYAMPTLEYYATAPPPPPQTTPMVFPMDQPWPPLQVMFDASRPPPSPNQVLLRSGPVKHKSPNSCEAGPSKIRKPEDCNFAEAHCLSCAERELRIDLCKQEIDKLLIEEEYQTLLYKKKLEDYESGKKFLESRVSPELFGTLEVLIEVKTSERSGAGTAKILIC